MSVQWLDAQTPRVVGRSRHLNDLAEATTHRLVNGAFLFVLDLGDDLEGYLGHGHGVRSSLGESGWLGFLLIALAALAVACLGGVGLSAARDRAALRGSGRLVAYTADATHLHLLKRHCRYRLPSWSLLNLSYPWWAC